ncbi:MAG: DegT/DnrJ/EryC1/StrS family aminotransferase [Planctomycetales bacterium]|nr:DegT/DnrJ/EryC1/StrS family aminotransferase [Planctomycetales bacterium]
MWVRKRIDISTNDLVRGLAGCIRPGGRGDVSLPELPNRFVACLSIRSGFDSLLSAVDWPHGSEVLMTAITIGDMPRIVEHHGFRAVPVDIAPQTLAPSVSGIESLITPRTRAIVVTHLAGGTIELGPIRRLCDDAGLMLIDDRAQAFVGTREMISSSRQADVSMWSFGPVKTATALGAGVISVRDESLRQRMRQRLTSTPIQSRFAYGRRITKYAAIGLLSQRTVSGAIAQAFRVTGRDHDQFVAEMARGFAGDGFFCRIRRQPSPPLIRMLRNRVGSYDGSSIEHRRNAGKLLIRELDGILPVLGDQMIDPTYWFFSVLAEQPEPLIRSLWRAGFDATNRSSLRRVGADDTNRSMVADLILKHMVMLPIGGGMPGEEIKRMASVIREAKPVSPGGI